MKILRIGFWMFVFAVLTGWGTYNRSVTFRSAVDGQFARCEAWYNQIFSQLPHTPASRGSGERTAVQSKHSPVVRDFDLLPEWIRQCERRISNTTELALEFRRKYQRAAANSSFPITVQGETFTEKQAVRRVSILLAELETYQQELQRLTRLRATSPPKLKLLTRSQPAPVSGDPPRAVIDSDSAPKAIPKPEVELKSETKPEAKQLDLAGARRFLVARSVADFMD